MQAKSVMPSDAVFHKAEPLRIAVLSAGNGWHVRDLMRAAVQKGHDAIGVDFRRVNAAVGAAFDSLAGFHAVLVRTMPPGSLEQVVFRMDVLHQLRARRAVVVNPPAAVETCVDKYLTTAKLEAAGLRVPPTVVCQHADAAFEAFDELGGDVVVKPLFGSEGRGMVRVSDAEIAWRTFRTLERTQSVLYLQRFIPHPGWDLRAFVLNGRVIAAMKRWANGDWRTNVAQGGRAEPSRLAEEQERLALAAAEAVGAVVAGVDLLPGKDGTWYVLEVNAVPGWRTLAPVTGVDVAAALADHIAAECASW
jgi:ribosomal protein S6--L-glutamate ligase